MNQDHGHASVSTISLACGSTMQDRGKKPQRQRHRALPCVTLSAQHHQIVVAVQLGVSQEIESVLHGEHMSNGKILKPRTQFALAMGTIKETSSLRWRDVPHAL